jgi:carboxymethylenebutenolidase
MADVSIQTPHRLLRGYAASPAGAGPWPGAVVIHDIFGMTDDLRAQADWLASAGYVALAPDFFSWGRKIPCLISTMREFQRREGAVFDDIDAARTWLAGREDCTGQIGVIGFCMGGGFALLMAAGHQFAVSSVNYGWVPSDVETIVGGACPMVASFGKKDSDLRGAAARLEHALHARGIACDVKEYADAGHAFMNRHDNMLVKLATVLRGAGYHEPSAADARQRILAFFARHLAGVPSSAL